MTISTKADEASMKAARMAIFGKDRKGSDFASGPWSIRIADLAHRMRAFADETAADALRAYGDQREREALERAVAVCEAHEDQQDKTVRASAVKRAIRDLIPKDPTND